PPPPAPAEALSSSSLMPASLITDSASLTPAPDSPVSTKRSVGGSASTRPQPTMKWSLAIQKGTATLLPADAINSCRFAAREIEGRKEMVEKRSPDDTVDPLCAKALRELAQG